MIAQLVKAAALLMLAVLAGCGSLSARDRAESANLPTLSAGMHRRADRLSTIDGQPVRGNTYKLWPGRHRVAITTAFAHCPQCGWAFANSLVAAMPLFVSLPIAVAAQAVRTDEPDESFSVSSGPLTKCFIARSGHAYHVRTSYQQGTWVFEIIDETSTYDVSSPC